MESGLTSVTGGSEYDTLNATIRTASSRRASGSAAFHGSPPRYSLTL